MFSHQKRSKHLNLRSFQNAITKSTKYQDCLFAAPATFYDRTKNCLLLFVMPQASIKIDKPCLPYIQEEYIYLTCDIQGLLTYTFSNFLTRKGLFSRITLCFCTGSEGRRYCQSCRSKFVLIGARSRLMAQ